MATEEVTVDQIKATIKCIHDVWYNENWLDTAASALKMHRHMEALFNYAGITSTLVEGGTRPAGTMTPSEFKKLTNIVETSE